MSNAADVQLGQLLIADGLASKEQVAEALAEQSAGGAYVPLGRRLVDKDILTARQLALVLERSDKRLKIGEVLRRNGAISDEQLEHALQEQRRVKRPLGEVLIKLGFVTEEVMRQALCLQLGVAYVDLDGMMIDKSLTRLINLNYARRHWLVPIARMGQALTVSMDDPTKTATVEELAQLTGYAVSVVTSSHAAIKRAFKRLYEQSIDPEQAASDGVQVETIAVDGQPEGDSSTAPKSRYVDEYFQDKKADAAVRQLIAIAVERRSSDVHLETLSGRMHIRFRVDGVLQELDLGSLQQNADHSAREIISRVKVLGKLDISERRRPQDGSFRVRMERGGETHNIDFRVSILPSYYGESCVLRILDKKNAPTTIDQLGFSKALSSKLRLLMQRTTGVLLVTGPTGSGKSTTLYSALMTAYRPEIRVLTAEDPIEYVYDQFSQSEVNDRIGNTFARYLRAFLRHDPEVIMIGEIRDEETAEMAFRAAQTGHLLLSTLHTNDAVSTVTRLLDMKVDSNLLASSLLGVLGQRLARTVCKSCARPYRPAPELLREFFAEVPPGLTFYQGAGCPACNHTGYRGRTSVAELWTPSQQDVILISKGANFDEIRNSARQSTISMAEDVVGRLAAGRTNLEELIRVMPYSAVYRFRELSKEGFPPAELAG
jgi:type II secretory ATPase GspE/PulE/Tfp pilus assembly ATPase PilB-like protein